MAPTTLSVLALALAISVSVQGDNLNCKDLNVDTCAFAVESSGKRCVLEKSMCNIISKKYTCAASEIVADNQNNHLIETDECVSACGVDRKALGISSDSLLEPSFIGNLCSDACYNSCPNIIDLYFNLAAGEGVYLPKLCEARESHVRREMFELRSFVGNFVVAAGPLSRTASAPLSGAEALSISEVSALAPGN